MDFSEEFLSKAILLWINFYHFGEDSEGES